MTMSEIQNASKDLPYISFKLNETISIQENNTAKRERRERKRKRESMV